MTQTDKTNLTISINTIIDDLNDLKDRIKDLTIESMEIDLNQKLSTNFTLKELVRSSKAEELKIDNTPTQEIVDNLKRLCVECLQPIRDKIGKSMTITSGYRSPVVNSAVKGSKTSAHVSGFAADIQMGSKTANKELYDLIVEMMKDGFQLDQLINEYDYSWIHVGIAADPTKYRNQQLSIL